MECITAERVRSSRNHMPYEANIHVNRFASRGEAATHPDCSHFAVKRGEGVECLRDAVVSGEM